jgi:hypothetical protein
MDTFVDPEIVDYRSSILPIVTTKFDVRLPPSSDFRLTVIANKGSLPITVSSVTLLLPTQTERWLKYRKTDRQTDIETGRQIDRQTDKQTDRQAGR